MGKQKEAETAGENITQKEAVSRALAAGKDSPSDGVAYVKEQFGITLNNGAFSTLKSQLKKASGAAPSGHGRKSGRPAASANNARTGGMSSGGRTPNPAELARQVKGLIATYGAVAVSDMVAVFTD